MGIIMIWKGWVRVFLGRRERVIVLVLMGGRRTEAESFDALLLIVCASLVSLGESVDSDYY
jgi:hypothetical protein